MKYVVRVGDQAHEVVIDGSTASVGGVETKVHLAEIEGTPIRVVTIDDRVRRVLVRRGAAAGQYSIDLGGYRFDVEAVDERTAAIRRLAGAAVRPVAPASLNAPMPGLVVRVLVAVGDRVQAGQALVVIEAMKMENELRASVAGVVRGLAVAAGEAVEKGALLVELDPAG